MIGLARAQEQGQAGAPPVQPGSPVQAQPLPPQPSPGPPALPPLPPPIPRGFDTPGTEAPAPPQPQAPQPRPGQPAPRTPGPTTTPTQPAAPSAPQVRPGEMLFNFQDADIQAVVKTVSQITGRNFLIDPRVKGKITIISAKPVPTRAIYQIFLSALKAQGFTAVEGPAGIIKVLPEAEGKQSAVVSESDVPKGGDLLTTQVVTIEHGSATQMVPLLRPLMAPSGLLSVYAPTNTLIITDYADNIRRLLQVIEKLDQPGSSDIVIIPLEYASALDMAQLLGRLADNVTVGVGQPAQPGQPGVSDPNRLSIVPDMRTNSLLVRTDNQGRLMQLRSLIAKLDVPAKAGGNTRVVYLRNAEAVKIAEVLRGLLAGEQRAARPQAQPGQPAAAPAAAEASLIQADEASNALIISAADAVYNNLRAVIDKLDARRAQVFVEALIAEVSADKTAEFGFQWVGGTPYRDGTIGVATNFTNGGASLSGTIGAVATDNIAGAIGAGLSVAYVGPNITVNGQEILGLGGLARALETDRMGNVLSTPNLLTLDNAEAKIVVGRNVPFLTGSYAQTGTTGTAGVNPFQTIERRDVGLQLKIKPQISEGNTVKLQISQEVSSIAQTAIAAQDLITDKRTLDTTVVVDDGATIVLGGLIDEKTNESIQEVPILSKIPILGELFRYRVRSKEKTNLMIFLRPVIVRNAQQANVYTEERYEYIRNIQAGGTMRPSLLLPEFSTPVLPKLKQPPLKEEPPVTGEAGRDAPRPGAGAKVDGKPSGANGAAAPSVAPTVPPAPDAGQPPEPLLGPGP